MDKQCCNVNVTELDNGYRFEITGSELKEKIKTHLEKCCTEENLKNHFSQCCGTK